MDDDFPSLELELKRLRPLGPPSSLVDRLANELDARPRRLWQAPWFWGVVLPAAAAVAVLVGRPWRSSERIAATNAAGDVAAVASSAAMLKPVAVENLLYAAEDEGIVTLADGTAARRERLQYMDTIVWRNPRTNASLTWTVPREEVRVVPVSLQ